MIVVAVDPGKATGIALVEIGAFVPRPTLSEAPPMAAIAYIELAEADLIVCESFIPRPGVRTWQPDALEIIGALRYSCWQRQVPFELQSPADAKRFATNDKLDRLEWRQPSQGGHMDDAARHLLLACVRHGFIDAGVFT